MRNPAIADASPLIVLAKIGQLPLLQLAGDPVFVPRAVEQEILAGGPTDAAAKALPLTDWLVVVDGDPVVSAVAQFRLGAGEAQVLSWAQTHPGKRAYNEKAAAFDQVASELSALIQQYTSIRLEETETIQHRRLMKRGRDRWPVNCSGPTTAFAKALRRVWGQSKTNVLGNL